MSAESRSKHILLVSLPAWGHLRPLASLAAKLLYERPDVIVTLTATIDFQYKLESEIDRYFNGDKEYLKNIRILYIGIPDTIVSLAAVVKEMSQAFNKAYLAIYEEKPVTCATGRVFPKLVRPSVIIMDFFLLDILRNVREINGSVPVLAWNSASSNAALRYFGPLSLGGLGNISLEAEKLVKETGRFLGDIISELAQPCTGKIINLPGMPAMYDYEFNSHHTDSDIMSPMIREILFINSFPFLQECDGMVAIGTPSFEPEVCATYRVWFAPRPVYFVAPLLPGKTTHSQDTELNVSPNGAEVKRFLDTIHKSHGDYSLLYVSFGSLVWPIGETVWKLLQVILDMNIPLILSHNPRHDMPSYLQRKFKDSELALISNWAPQHVILGHRVTGFFLTHCGNNSLTESISYGVPMIAWPLTLDQYVSAAYTSSILDIAYELYETRIKDGLRPLCRGIRPSGTLEAAEKELRSVLVKAHGIDGTQKREIIHDLQKKINSAWDENGEARRALREFWERFCPLQVD